MNIVTFFEMDESLFDSNHKVEHFHSGASGEADIAIINIDTIFEFEENKANACKKKFVSIAVIDDESDYDAFKNFGIDAWIKGNDIHKINNIINLVEKKLLS